MELSFSTAQNGLYAANLRQNTIANNLSNLTTDGFKAQLVDQGTLEGPGTRVQGILDSFSQGAPRQSESRTHLFIEGDGFFRVELEGTSAYTRLGNFRIDADGNLVTPAGFLLEPSINIPEDAVGVTVTREGIVYSIDSDGLAEEQGQVELARFVNPAGLLALGDNLYARTLASGDPVEGLPGDPGLGLIRQNILESSNVDPAQEMTQQIINQRYYQLNLRVFQTSDALVGRAIDLFS